MRTRYLVTTVYENGSGAIKVTGRIGVLIYMALGMRPFFKDGREFRIYVDKVIP